MPSKSACQTPMPNGNAATGANLGHDCSKHTKSTRNIIVCIDGTSNQFSKNNTSVIELYHLLVKDESQVTYYNSGVGTYAKQSWVSWASWKQAVSNKIDTAIAWNLEHIIMDAYRWLADTYQHGDRIFLFGFSRGAYQVRALSAMINKVGLIHRGNADQIPFAYELFSDRTESVQADRFKETFSRSVDVHFVGVWDTVSSVDIIRGKTLPGTTDGMVHVCHFRHALALDERRVKFLPEFAYGGSSLPGRGQIPHPDSKEVWFAGVHSDIGGGYLENTNLNQSGPPLMWMLSEAVTCGLNISTATSTNWNWDKPADGHESLKGLWYLLEYIPVTQTSYDPDNNQGTRWTWHAGDGRQMREGQFIHASVIRALDAEPAKGQSKYVPKAKLPSGKGWDKLTKHEREALVERDFFHQVQDLVRKFREASTETIVSPDAVDGLIKTLLGYTKSDVGRWAIGVVEHSAINQHILDLVQKVASRPGNDNDGLLVRLVRAFLSLHSKGIQGRTSIGAFEPIATRLWDNSQNSPNSVINLLNSLIDDCVFGMPFAVRTLLDGEAPSARINSLCDNGQLAEVYTEHIVSAVTVSCDSRHIISGSYDNNVRIWGIVPGATTYEPLRGHAALIRTVAVSPNGKYIASGSDDYGVRIWDFATGTNIKVLRGHKGIIRDLCFTADSKSVITGSNDGAVIRWDVESGFRSRTQPDLSGTSTYALSFATSADKKYLASGFNDGYVYVWDLDTGKRVDGSLMCHNNTVRSVAFSPDSKYIVSGSLDDTIQIWRVGEWIPRGEPLKGHTNDVMSVAVSPNGKFIASGSGDETVRVWDFKTGQVLKELKGHRDWIRTIAFAPDGSYIVSGSDDGTIRRWDLKALGLS